jgi:hypothetical protein
MRTRTAIATLLLASSAFGSFTREPQEPSRPNDSILSGPATSTTPPPVAGETVAHLSQPETQAGRTQIRFDFDWAVGSASDAICAFDFNEADGQFKRPRQRL